MTGRSPEPMIHEEPCGTRDELVASFLPLNQYGFCGPRVKDSDGKIVEVGCFNWNSCRTDDCKFKGKSSAEGGGPRNGVLRIVQKLSSGKPASRHIPCPCYHVTEMRDAHEGRGTKESPVMVEVVQWEGEAETFKLPGTKNVDETVPGEGVKRIAMATIHDWPLKPFPRPKDNPTLAEEAFNAALMREKQDGDRAKVAAELGMPARKR